MVNDRRSIRFLKASLALAAVALVTASSGANARAAGAVAGRDPMMATKAMVNGALAVLRDPHVSLSDERDRLRAIADAHLDFESMARSTLGYHWRDLTPDRRTRFTALFKSFIEDAYLSRIQDYSGQDVAFQRETMDGTDYGEVYSQVVSNNSDEPVQLNFMLHRENGEWKIYDVAVDDISITANYRSQFNRVINDQGFDALMATLTTKEQQLAAYLGKKK